MYIEYLTHEYFIRQPPVSTQGENDCVGIERVGGPLSADAEENLWKYGPFPLPLSVSPFLSLVYSIFLMLLALLLLFYEGMDVFTIKMLFTKKKKDLRNVWKDTSLISNSLGSLSNKRSEFKYYVVQIILRSLLHCHGYQASQIKQNSVGSFHCRCCLWKLNETRSARAEQKLHCWSRNKQRRAYALKTPSPRGKGGQKLLRGKR